MSITLLLGGVRSGKSAKALELARVLENHAGRGNHSAVLFVATAQSFDAEMSARIAVHRMERDQQWQTLEEPIALPERIDTHLQTLSNIDIVVIDCMTLWVSNLLLSITSPTEAEATIAARVHALIAIMQPQASQTHVTATERHFIIVSNEVGLGVVPPTPLGRAYRDALGRANQILAAAATRVTLMVAGLELRIK